MQNLATLVRTETWLRASRHASSSTRLPTAMRHRDDENVVPLHRVKDAVREDAGQAAPNVLVENPPAPRCVTNPVERILDSANELSPHGRISF